MDRTYQSADYGTGRMGSRSYNPGAGYRGYDEGHASDQWHDSDRWRGREEGRRHQGSRSRDSLDVTGWLGMLIGGAVGYALASTMRGSLSQSHRIGRNGQGTWSQHEGRSSGSWLGSSSESSSGSVEMDETTDLIASNKVEGTAVYNRQGERLGDVYNFMVGKRSGRVAYAVMSFGGLLGMGQSYHPLPWNALTYDTNKGGYVIDADKNRLTNAPSYRAGEDPFSQPGYHQRVRDYWSAGLI
jgi:hypothetical protein